MYNVCDDNMICIYSYEILLFYYSDVITFDYVDYTIKM